MIRIQKGPVPAVLLGRGAKAAKRHRDAYDADPGVYQRKDKTLPIVRGIYADATVFNALNAVQHGKCAYCEYKIPRGFADADIDHWRPKAGVRQTKSDQDVYPGYYWLAYDWDNLVVACQFCNRRNKSTLFPLLNPADRALNHNHDVAREVPATLRPDGLEDPRDHICFVDEIPKALTALGRETIALVGLDRLEHRPREERLNALRDAHELIVKHEGKPDKDLAESVSKWRRFLEGAVLPDAPFSAMAMDFLARNPLPPPPVA